MDMHDQEELVRSHIDLEGEVVEAKGMLPCFRWSKIQVWEYHAGEVYCCWEPARCTAAGRARPAAKLLLEITTTSTAKNKKCYVCNKPTLGIFNAAQEIRNKMAQDKKQQDL